MQRTPMRARRRPAEPAHEIDILHQRDRGKAADRVIERAGDQQPLVAIGQRQNPATPGDDPLQPPRRRGGIVERKIEIAGAALGSGRRDEAADRLLPSRRRAGNRHAETSASRPMPRPRRRRAECRAPRAAATTSAPELRARRAVSSRDPPSTTMISPTTADRRSAASIGGSVSAAFRVGMTTDIRIRSCNVPTIWLIIGRMDMPAALSPRKGRGAASNDSGRFEAEKRVAFDDGWGIGRGRAGAAGDDPERRLDANDHRPQRLAGYRLRPLDQPLSRLRARLHLLLCAAEPCLSRPVARPRFRDPHLL